MRRNWATVALTARNPPQALYILCMIAIWQINYAINYANLPTEGKQNTSNNCLSIQDLFLLYNYTDSMDMWVII